MSTDVSPLDDRVGVTAPPSLPPGAMGLPLLGETLAFLDNPFAFLEQRQRRHGDVWKSRMLGRRIVFLSGLEGAAAFFDGDNISRADAHPFPLVDLFGGINMQMYDGPRHQALKAMALGAFDHRAIAGYLPDMQALLGATLERLADGQGPGGDAGVFSAVEELRKLAIEALCLNVLGIARGARTEAICRDYAAVLQGLVSIPLPLPGTPYGRARAARDRLLRTIRETIAQRRARPGQDALSRMLQARARLPDGSERAYTDEEALLEVHHIVIAGFIVYALMAEGLRRLADDPALLARVRAEVEAHAPAGALTMEAMARLRLTTQVVLEAKRHVPLVPLAFGKARRDFSCGGHNVPAGWTVYLALWLCNRDPRLYRDPDRFDPDRFGPGRAEHQQHPLAFVPQGTDPGALQGTLKGSLDPPREVPSGGARRHDADTGHRCLGLDYSTFLTLAFLALLVRGYSWELPPQDLDYRWTTVPPQHKDGLRVRLRRRG
jgi:retinoid hydroxylase